MHPKNIILAIGLAAALVLGAMLALRSQTPANPEFAQVMPAPVPVPAFSLLTQHNETVDQSVFEGQWDLVFFGFTHCPDICPTTMQVLSAARATLADEGEEPLPRIVLVSVDPERDTPEAMGQYVDYFGSGNLGLTGTLEEIRKLTTGLGIYFEKQPGDGDAYVVDHFAGVLLVDPNGGFHALFRSPHVAANYVQDLPRLMGDR